MPLTFHSMRGLGLTSIERGARDGGTVAVPQWGVHNNRDGITAAQMIALGYISATASGAYAFYLRGTAP